MRKNQVVGAGSADVQLSGHQGVGHGRQEVRGKHQVCAALLAERLKHFVHGAVEANVGVDVDDVLIALLHQMRQRPRLDGGVELQHAVLE